MPNTRNLVLVPGLVCDAAAWEHQATHLGELAGIFIPAVDADETMEGMARRALADAPRQFALAGFSMGGYVALEILRQAPERVTRLALLDTTARYDTPKKTAWRQSAIAACERGGYAAVIDEMMQILVHPDRRGGPLESFVKDMAARIGVDTFVRRQRAMMTRSDSRDLLRAARLPLRIISGRQDGMCSLDDHAEMVELSPHARFSVIEDCSHMTIIERPQAATTLLRDWLLYD